MRPAPRPLLPPSAKRLAVARPMPLDAPVTTTTDWSIFGPLCSIPVTRAQGSSTTLIAPSSFFWNIS
jgi:hypothetical protein